MKLKRIATALLVGVLTLTATPALASTQSPTSATVEQEKGTQTVFDKKHNGNVITAKLKDGKNATVTKVTGKGKGKSVVELHSCKTKSGIAPYQYVGTGKKKNVFQKSVKTVAIMSKKKVTIRKYAFYKSNVKTLNLAKLKSSVLIKKNAFKGTKTKNIVLKVKNVKKVTFEKGAFKGLKTIRLKGSKKAKKAIMKKLIKAGVKKSAIRM